MKKDLLKYFKITIFTYVVFYLFMTILYCLPRILAEYSNFEFISKLPTYELFNIEEFSKYLIACCAVYSGAGTKLGSVLNINKKDFVDSDKIKIVLILLTGTFFITYILNMWLGHNFKLYTDFGTQSFEVIRLPQDNILAALGTTSVLFLGGCENDEEKINSTNSDDASDD